MNSFKAPWILRVNSISSRFSCSLKWMKSAAVVEGGNCSVISLMVDVDSVTSLLCQVSRLSISVSRSGRVSARRWMESFQLPKTSDQSRMWSLTLGSRVSMLEGFLVKMVSVRESNLLVVKATESSLGNSLAKACPERSWTREGLSEVPIEAMNSSLRRGTRGGNLDKQIMRRKERVKRRVESGGASEKEREVMGLEGES